jgi:hypothetical protein
MVSDCFHAPAEEHSPVGSSDRHITQNALELKEYKWIPATRTLEGEDRINRSFR